MTGIVEEEPVESIEALVRRARARDPSLAQRHAAFSAIVAHFQDTAYSYALAHLGDTGLAEDAAQEAFLTAYRHLDDLHDPATFPAWFRRVMPVDAQILASVRQVQVWKLVEVALGLALIGASLAQRGSTEVLSVLAFVVALVAGGAMIYSILLMLATLSFWVVRVENLLVIFQAAWETGRWPVGIYPAWLRYALTFLVPVGFATTIPAEAIVGRLNTETLIASVALAAGLLALSRWLWLAGLRHYAGASA